MVAARGITRSFRQGSVRFNGLAEASFEIMKGERIAIVGASGSGKSTLLNLVAAIDQPTSGAIAWPAFGDIDALRPGKIAVAFQQSGLMAPLSVIENVELPLLLMVDTAKTRQRAMTALDLFGLGGLADKLPEELSGGEAQRVGLARAIVTSPNLLLADEPTGQLDSATGREVLAVLLGWAEARGSGLLIATHDRAVANALDRVWRMDHGHLTHGDRLDLG